MAGKYNCVNFNADYAGCWFYRMGAPRMSLITNFKDINIMSSQKLIGHHQFFRDIRLVRLQRQVNDNQLSYFNQFLYPLSKQIGFHIVYELDDVIRYEDIPKWNVGRSAYKNENFFKNVKIILEKVDMMTVTSHELKDYYITHYNIDKDRVVVIPNMLPKWWIGNSFDINKSIINYRDNIKKPRIGFPISTSHIDAKGINNYVDDFSHINDFIKSTVDKYQWVFVGGFPKQLEKEVKDKKIEFYSGIDILNYPQSLARLNLNLIVAPLKSDEVFNKCKSNIKLLESWAIGIPVIAQDIECYNKYTNNVFTDSNSLQNKIDNIIGKEKTYSKIIKSNYNIINNGDENKENGWWLEKNLKTWRALYCPQQKTLNFDLRKINFNKQKTEKPLEI